MVTHPGMGNESSNLSQPIMKMIQRINNWSIAKDYSRFYVSRAFGVKIFSCSKQYCDHSRSILTWSNCWKCDFSFSHREI